MKFEIKIDQLKLNPSALNAQSLMPHMLRAMKDINADQQLKYSQGLDPDGKKQKPYSAAYRRQILSKDGVKGPKGRPGKQGQKAANTPNLRLTGDLMNSATVARVQNSAVIAFGRDQMKKVRGLKAKGFNFHLFGRDQEKLVQEHITRGIAANINKLIKIIRS